ncbi:MAG: LPS export ABC transporter periplasmic protein LptC [Deltaproteobacteria bacterium]|nr:LPS export ABC transporter periplasmic protein LptC [Deltaproteobacteria bacterium]MBI3387553.1 LPS export ABC transporter periplasmic protein LptC [Deltaproteobacteria bacterium]
MRNRLRLSVVAIVLGLLGGIGFLITQSLRAQWKQEAAQTGLDLLPQIAQRIQDFHRIKTQDGRTVWEIAAREAQYLEDEHEVVVQEPMVRLFLKDGRSIGLSGQTGRISLDGRELRQVDLTGGIEVQFADYTVRTDRAQYLRATDRISSPQRVNITGRELDLSGDRMEVDVAAQRLRVFRNVEMTLRPGSHQEAPHDRPAPRP